MGNRSGQFMLLFLMLFSLSGLAQDLRDKSPGVFRDTIIDRDDIILPDSNWLSSSRKAIVLIDNEAIQLLGNQSTLVKILEEKYTKYEIESDQELLQLIKGQSEAKNSNLTSLNTKLQNRLDYVLAKLIEQGNCLVFEKQTGKLCDVVTFKTYLESNASGRRFYTPSGALILETHDGSF